MATRQKPLKRRDDLIVQKLGEEAIVYDRVSHRAHSLNRPAALVFDSLDGKRSLADVTKGVAKTLGKTKADGIVAAAINDLEAAGLMVPGAALPRRSVLRGLAAGLIPVVASIAVPPAAAAASCIVDGGSCVYTSDCCPGLICIDVGSGILECMNP
jgi:hypothetical protein